MPILSSMSGFFNALSVGTPMDFTILCKNLQNRRIYHNSLQLVHRSAYHRLMNCVLLASAFFAISTTSLRSVAGSSRQWSRWTLRAIDSRQPLRFSVTKVGKHKKCLPTWVNYGIYKIPANFPIVLQEKQEPQRVFWGTGWPIIWKIVNNDPQNRCRAASDNSIVLYPQNRDSCDRYYFLNHSMCSRASSLGINSFNSLRIRFL